MTESDTGDLVGKSAGAVSRVVDNPAMERMTADFDASGVRVLRWSLTGLAAVALLIVVLRVSACLGDDLCTFAPGALQSAVMAFVGGPVLVLAVWMVPAILLRRPVASWVGVVLLGGAAMAVGAGVLTMANGGPAAAIVPSLAPALGVAGLLVLIGGGISRSE